MTLEVRPSNSRALALYKKFGFEEAGRRKGYYEENNEDAIIMWLHFDMAKDPVTEAARDEEPGKKGKGGEAYA